MSIEQTNQLILLTLNSVLMTLLSSFLLGGTWLRQNTLLKQIRQTRSHYHRIARQEDAALLSASLPRIELATPRKMSSARQLKQVREQRQRLSYQYQWSRVGLLILHAAVLTFIASLFALALRSLLAFDSLIHTALLLFTIGTAGLLTGTGCVLVDFAQGNSKRDSLGRSFAQIIQQITRHMTKPLHSQKRRLAARADANASRKFAELKA